MLVRRLGRILRSNITELRDRLTHADKTTGEDHAASWKDKNGFYKQAEHSSDSREAEYLANLELREGASLQIIRSAYKRMIKKYHPDLHARDEEKREYAELITQRLNEALDYFEKKYKKGG